MRINLSLPLIGQWVYTHINRIGQWTWHMNDKFWEMVYGKGTENDRKQL